MINEIYSVGVYFQKV